MRQEPSVPEPTGPSPTRPSPTRRTFNKRAIQSLLTFSLLDTLCLNDVFAAKVKPITARWIAELNALGREVKDEKLKQVQWQKKVQELFAKVELPELLKGTLPVHERG